MGGPIRSYNTVKYLYGTGDEIHLEFLDTFHLMYKKHVTPPSKGHGLKRDHSKDKGHWTWLPELESKNIVGEFELDDAGSMCIIITQIGEIPTTGQIDKTLTEWLFDEDVQRRLIMKLAFNDIIIQELYYVK